MVRIGTLTRVLGVVSLFGDAKPYDIHSVTMMNYESIRSTLIEAQKINTITVTGNNTVSLTPFGKTYVEQAGIPEDITKAFGAYSKKKKRRLSEQVNFLNDGKKPKAGSKGNK